MRVRVLLTAHGRVIIIGYIEEDQGLKAIATGLLELVGSKAQGLRV